MDLALDLVEGNALHGLLEEASDDVLVKLDANGFIVHASANITQLGEDLMQQLVLPHIGDLCDQEHSDLVIAYADKILGGHSGGGTIEFPVSICDGKEACDKTACRRWYSLSLRPIFKDEQGRMPVPAIHESEPRIAGGGARRWEHGDIAGAVGLLRSVQRVRLLESELHSRSVTDPLTGLLNRHAFSACLRRQLANGTPQVVIVFAVDRMRSLLLQYGQRTADEIQWGFAKFLETMVQDGYELAQLDDERLGVMIPKISLVDARDWAQDVLNTFSSLAISSSQRMPKLGASAGLANLESTVDWTLKQAELALVIARAGGGMQVGQCTYQST
ncbi:MAG: GGDEF domain-containing protein [Pseudomonadota bacterium]